MDQARAITATLDAGPQTLTVTASGTGPGTVTLSPLGINCGNGNSMCSMSQPFGTSSVGAGSVSSSPGGITSCGTAAGTCMAGFRMARW